MKVTNRKEFEWKSREVFNAKGLKNKLQTTGYEAFRISPRATTKYGKSYKRIYGATVAPDYSRPVYGKKNTYGAKVEWHPHGYTSASVKGGTRLLTQLKNYPVNQREARMKLMLKSRRK